MLKYGNLIVGYSIIALALISVCAAFYSGNWRLLVGCLPIWLIRSPLRG